MTLQGRASSHVRQAEWPSRVGTCDTWHLAPPLVFVGSVRLSNPSQRLVPEGAGQDSRISHQYRPPSLASMAAAPPAQAVPPPLQPAAPVQVRVSGPALHQPCVHLALGVDRRVAKHGRVSLTRHCCAWMQAAPAPAVPTAPVGAPAMRPVGLPPHAHQQQPGPPPIHLMRPAVIARPGQGYPVPAQGAGELGDGLHEDCRGWSTEVCRPNYNCAVSRQADQAGPPSQTSPLEPARGVGAAAQTQWFVGL